MSGAHDLGGRRAAALLGSVAAASALLSACGGTDRSQSVLEPGNAATRSVDGHWQLLLVTGSAVFVIVMAVMVVAVWRRRRRHDDDHDDERGRSPGRVVMAVGLLGAVVPALVIIGVMAHSVLVLAESEGRGADATTVVEVDARQYWWEVRYPDEGVVTANEIHIPVGEEVRVEMTSSDVIHSLWVPRLSGKVDLIPGSTTTLTLSADEPGTYWGQCAEYCGLQHAWMRLVVVAHDEPEYAGWVEAQARPAEPAAGRDDEASADGEQPAPFDAETAEGREIFMSSSCVYCHTVAGTEATGTLGPDLTHFASRQTIGAGVLENDRENLARWIEDPQGVKPGNAMPGTDISADELDALLTYLESLE